MSLQDTNNKNDDDNDQLPPPPSLESYLSRVSRSVDSMGQMQKPTVEPGDVVFAKVDIPSLNIYRDVGYDLLSIYHQGLDEETGRIERKPVESLDTPVERRGYTRYVRLYSPAYHGDDVEKGAVVVTPEEVGLVSMGFEIGESVLLAVPGLFWVFLCIYFTNIYQERYGGSFVDALLGR